MDYIVKNENAEKRDGGKVLPSLLISDKERILQRALAFVGNSFLLLVTSLSMVCVLFILYFIAKDAFPFFKAEGVKEFFLSTRWYPSAQEPEFGALAIFVGSGLVTLGAIIVAVPIGITAAVCLSDVIPFSLRQAVKPVIELLAAIPSVAYGFFALVVFAPLLQEKGGNLLSIAWWVIATPFAFIITAVVSDLAADKFPEHSSGKARIILWILSGILFFTLLYYVGENLRELRITTGTNALNVSIILGIMALPTVVSVSEDALQAVGRELREGSYALGATRAETMIKIVIPAAGSGILAAIILGVMRAIGETMVVWMASGNASQIPKPWYNFTEPVRTLTATIAGDMGEADHVTGSARYHVLFAMAFCLLIVSFCANLASEFVLIRSKKKMGK